jgi:regulator of nucleoside diphosphate kinase
MGDEPSMLTARDRYVLERLGDTGPHATKEWLDLLRRKLSGGSLPAGAPVPGDLATVDARVAFRCESGLRDVRTLCLPGLYVPGAAFLPVTTLYGLALLGLREGQSVEMMRPGGRPDRILLEKVLFMPARHPPGEPLDARRPLRLSVGGAPARAWCRALVAANENAVGEGDGPPAA